MSVLDELAECSGRWRGTNRIRDPGMNVLDDSPSTAELTPLLDGGFLRLDYTWAYQGAAQEPSSGQEHFASLFAYLVLVCFVPLHQGMKTRERPNASVPSITDVGRMVFAFGRPAA